MKRRGSLAVATIVVLACGATQMPGQVSLVLLLVGLTLGAIAYWLIADRGATPLVLVPSIVAATVGACHLVKQVAPRG